MCPCTVELLPYRFFFLSFSRVTWTFFRPFFPQFRFSLSLSLFLRLFICAFSPSFRLRPTCFPRSSFTSFFLGIQRISPYNSSAGRK